MSTTQTDLDPVIAEAYRLMRQEANEHGECPRPAYEYLTAAGGDRRRDPFNDSSVCWDDMRAALVDTGLVAAEWDHVPPVLPGYLERPERGAVAAPVVAAKPRPELDKAPAAKPTRAPKATAKAKPRKPPTTGVETRAPKDQNEHTLAMINSHQLGKLPMLVAMIASVEIAITAANQGVPFGQAVRDLAPSYVALKAGIKEDTARTNLAHAVRLGFLERVDDAQGGRRLPDGTGVNRAKYRARFPTYLDV